MGQEQRNSDLTERIVYLDPFAGSGTTILAAAFEGYSAVGIELSSVYASLARERLKNNIIGGHKDGTSEQDALDD